MKKDFIIHMKSAAAAAAAETPGHSGSFSCPYVSITARFFF